MTPLQALARQAAKDAWSSKPGGPASLQTAGVEVVADAVFLAVLHDVRRRFWLTNQEDAVALIDALLSVPPSSGEARREKNDDKTFSAELIGQIASPVAEIEPRLTMIAIEHVCRLIRSHRRHVELSPGVGIDVQTYAFACYDDLLSDLESLVGYHGTSPLSEAGSSAQSASAKDDTLKLDAPPRPQTPETELSTSAEAEIQSIRADILAFARNEFLGPGGVVIHVPSLDSIMQRITAVRASLSDPAPLPDRGGTEPRLNERLREMKCKAVRARGLQFKAAPHARRAVSLSRL